MPGRRPRAGSLSSLVRRVERAREELHRARLALARATVPGDGSPVSSRLAWARRLFERLEAEWMDRPGVVGVAFGARRRRGVSTGEPSLTVFVREKLTRSELARRGRRPFPRFVGAGGRRLRVDVVVLKGVRRQANAGESLGPAGRTLYGTIGAAARGADGTRYAITAMHVMGMPQFPAGAAPAPRVVAPAGSGVEAGVLARGTQQGVDAAAIALRPGFVLRNQAAGVGPLRGWRIVSYPADLGIPVQLCGATSGWLQGRIEYTHVTLSELALRRALLARIDTRRGDSGSALVDSAGMVLGFLCGRASADFGRLAAFSHASDVLQALECDIPTEAKQG